MKRQQFLTSLILLAALLVVMVGVSQAQAPEPEDAAVPAEAAVAPAAIGTAFTYQGQLKDGGNPANGRYDFQFTLYNTLSGGSQVGSILTKYNVLVTNGLFTVALDFGTVFDSTRLWLEIAVRPSGSTGYYTILSPRQELTPTPYAIQANRANALSAPDGDPRDAVHVDNAGNVGVGTTSPENAEHWGRVLDIRGPAGIASAKFSVRTDTIDARVVAHDVGFGGAPAGMMVGTKTTNPLSLITDNASRMTITAGGDVGVGTSSPEARLHVNGDAKVTGNLSWTGHLSSFTRYGHYETTAKDGQDWTYKNLVPSENAICFLMAVELEDIDSGGEQAGCFVRVSDRMWQLGAKAEDDSNAWCAAYCLGW